MKSYSSSMILTLFILIAKIASGQSSDFVIYENGQQVTLVYDTLDHKTIHIAVNLLAQDIEAVTGTRPKVSPLLEKAIGNVIIIGSVGSRLINDLANQKKVVTEQIKGKWEVYGLNTIHNLIPHVNQALVICGSDPRGTAYGVFDISQRIGISPWYWWADVTPQRKEKLVLPLLNFVSKSPSVKYRGIFLNDEDWALQPWAAKTFEPETGDIGPATYAKIFELLLRLKANLIWPAMHPCTKAFYHYPQSRIVADDYSIVVGSSHAEPMLRNNIDEWDKEKMGDYNYATNQQAVYRYWEERVKESKSFQNIYTIGMRGIHDSNMEGASSMSEKISLMEKIFNDQREILANHITKDVTLIPQAFIPYKEVLDIYDKGLKIPEDITIVWPDDNYGYIHRLNNDQERKRSGGSGVYYHLSYLGRPHDYLWLESTHPMLVWEEMSKAFHSGCDRIWVANVGDIKPLEYTMQLFLDMAYNIQPFDSPSAIKNHLQQWLDNIFEGQGVALADLRWEYFSLAFERRPEFMGWSQTEPTRPTQLTAYNHFSYNDEAQQRLDRYQKLSQKTDMIRNMISPARRDAFYELIYYPVHCAEFINQKFLHNDKASYYAQQHRASASDHAAMAIRAYDSIQIETNYYNTVLANGKWKYMMSAAPCGRPVYKRVIPAPDAPTGNGWGICLEGYNNQSPTNNMYGKELPLFYKGTNNKYFIDLFLTGTQTVSWKATTSHRWIKLNNTTGALKNESGLRGRRMWISIDWRKIPAGKSPEGSVVIEGGGNKFVVPVVIAGQQPDTKNIFYEQNGYISMFGEHYSRSSGTGKFFWKITDGFGYTGKVVQLTSKESVADTDSVAASLEYDFRTNTQGNAIITIYCIPNHAFNEHHKLRLTVGIDNQEPTLHDYRTFDRSETWKQNVLSNNARVPVTIPVTAGMHTLKITALDPEIIIDRITIDMGGLQPGYSVIPETKNAQED